MIPAHAAQFASSAADECEPPTRPDLPAATRRTYRHPRSRRRLRCWHRPAVLVSVIRMCFLRTIRLASRIANSTMRASMFILRCELTRSSRRLHGIQSHFAVLGLGNDLVFDDQDVAFVKAPPSASASTTRSAIESPSKTSRIPRIGIARNSPVLKSPD